MDMTNRRINEGDILNDITSGDKYRVIHIDNDQVYLCVMNTSLFSVITMKASDIFEAMRKETMVIQQVEDREMIFDEEEMDEYYRKRYQRVLKVIREVENEYGPTFIGLNGRKKKPKLEEILEKLDYPKESFWRNMRKFLQSGKKIASLVDAKAFGKNTGKAYDYQKKTGRQSWKNEYAGVALTQETRNNMDKAIKYYLDNKTSTMKDAFSFMNFEYYSYDQPSQGSIEKVFLPPTERPTRRQFEYYLKKHTTEEELQKKKSSAREFRNNKRLLRGSELDGALGPGDLVEVDEWEADISLLGAKGKTVGRPVVYFMIDVYTKAIVAMSVSYENNSYAGAMNLFVNLASNKKAYATKYGLEYESDDIWPSNFIPRRLRCDRGSEYIGEHFTNLCLSLGIQKENAPPAMGSMKGSVEQMFRQLALHTNSFVNKLGLIRKEYNSKHHEQATLVLEEYTKMVINFVLSHNMRAITTYPRTKEMIDREIQPIPCELWKYGVEKFPPPRPFILDDQYKWMLMARLKGYYNRSGIHYHDLSYLIPDNDEELYNQAIIAQNKRVPMEFRMDPNNINCIYYKKNNTLQEACLNLGRQECRDFANMSLSEYEKYRDKKLRQKSEAELYNQNVDNFEHMVNHQIVSGKKNGVSSDTSNIRENREQEKNKNAFSNRLFPEAVINISALPALGKDNVPLFGVDDEQIDGFGWDNVLDKDEPF